MHTAALVWDDALAAYRFTSGHPLDPRRLTLTIELIRALGLAGGPGRIVPGRIATDDEILTAHAPEYLAAVNQASAGSAPGADLLPFGLGTADVPVVAGMHEAAARVSGATLRAAELVMSGSVRRTFSIAGGLHHARRAQAAGFCIYNDIAIAIRWLQRAHGARVLYIDVDAHHGDGVQWIFYDDPDVLTLSFHEGGAFLFPGTGFVDELGEGDGHGYSVNVPLHPHTGDDSLLEAFDELVPAFARAFGPDIIILQAGCDAHVLDPLTHLRCTTALHETVVKSVVALAEELCDGRLVVTGGGGYAIHAVVPRAWTLVWAGLCGAEPPDELPEEWLARTRAESETPVPGRLRDRPGEFPPSPHAADAAATNRRTAGTVRRRSLPLVTGWGLGF